MCILLHNHNAITAFAFKTDSIHHNFHVAAFIIIYQVIKKSLFTFFTSNFYNISFVQFSSLLIHTKSSIYNSVLVKEREITFASLLPGVPMNVCTFPGFADLKPTDMNCAVSTQSHQAPALSINHILLSS